MDESIDSIKAALSRHGGAEAYVSTPEEAARWRRAARSAARELGRPVQTIVYQSGSTFHVAASLRDFPRTPEEERQREADMREVMAAVQPRALGIFDQ